MNLEIKRQIVLLFTGADADERRKAAETLAEFQSVKVASALALALQDSDKGVRDSALRALLLLKSEHAACAVAEYLTDSSFITRNLAAQLLVQFGSSAVESLFPYAVHENHDVRKMAVDTLGLIGDARAVPTLISLLNDSDRNVIVAAVEALGNIKDKSAIANIVMTFVSHDFARVVAAEALGKIGDVSASPFLISLLENHANPQGEEILVTYAVAEALANAGSEDSLEKISSLVRRTSGKMQHILLYALVSIAERFQQELSSYSEFRNEFINALRNDDLRIVIASAKALAAMPNDETENSLLEMLGKSEALDNVILSGLRNHGQSFIKLVKKYPTLNSAQKKTALEFLLPKISEIVTHYDGEAQQSRMRLFSLLTEEWVEAGEEMRGLIIDTLFYLNEEDAVAYFTTLLDDTYQWLRMRVLELIAQTNHYRSSEVLAACINDKDVAVREFARSMLRGRETTAQEMVS